LPNVLNILKTKVELNDGVPFLVTIPNNSKKIVCPKRDEFLFLFS
jgi:hypothetical protein